MTAMAFYAAIAVLLLASVWILTRGLLVVGSKSNRAIALTIAILLPLASAGIYAVYGEHEIIREPWIAQPTSQQTLIASIKEARERLENDSDNLNLILAIARGETLLQNYQSAITLYQRAMQLLGDRVDSAKVVLPYADALTMQNNAQVPDAAFGMLQQLYQQQPTNPEVLWALAIAAKLRGDSAGALDYWGQLLALTAETSPQLADKIRAEMAKLQTAYSLAVRVEIAPQLTPLPIIPSSAVLFVSVHQLLDTNTVIPMPIAAKRIAQFSLPYSVTLSDSDSLMGEKLLSSQHKIEIRARVSLSGSATPNSGDLIGKLSWSIDQPASSTVVITQVQQ